jgi:hypothetical protein
LLAALEPDVVIKLPDKPCFLEALAAISWFSTLECNKLQNMPSFFLINAHCRLQTPPFQLIALSPGGVVLEIQTLLEALHTCPLTKGPADVLLGDKEQGKQGQYPGLLLSISFIDAPTAHLLSKAS